MQGWVHLHSRSARGGPTNDALEGCAEQSGGGEPRLSTRQGWKSGWNTNQDRVPRRTCGGIPTTRRVCTVVVPSTASSTHQVQRYSIHGSAVNEAGNRPTPVDTQRPHSLGRRSAGRPHGVSGPLGSRRQRGREDIDGVGKLRYVRRHVWLCPPQRSCCACTPPSFCVQ